MEDENSRYLYAFVFLISEYCKGDNKHLDGRPENWWKMVISYSLYLRLGIYLFDEQLTRKLNDGMTQGTIDTSNTVLPGIDGVKMVEHKNEGEIWSHTVNYISNFMSIRSPETMGENANEDLVKQRAPWSGFIPGIRLFDFDSEFAKHLFNDAQIERQLCDEEELKARIDWMKRFVDEAIN